MIKIRTVLLVVVLVHLVGCGFHLRSDSDLAGVLGSTRLSIVNEFSPFARHLKNSLQRSGVELVESGGSAKSSIDVTVNTVTRNILSIGDTARVREYRISHRIEFSVHAASGEEILQRQVLEQSRDLSFDEGELLAATREEEFVREELSNSLVRLVVQRLGRLEAR